jgi:hypothetical protein
MPRIPFVGPSYVYNSVNYDAQRSLNMFPVASDVETSKDIIAMAPTPGLKLFKTLPAGRIRGGIKAKRRVFFVAASKLYELYADKTFIERGTLDTSSGRVSMAHNGQQVMLVDGPNGYVFNLVTLNFTKITSPGWRGARTVAYVDGYFLMSQPESGIYYITQLYDGTSLDSLDFASAEGSPDDIVAVEEVHKEVWLFGEDSVEVVFNSGAADFPFTRIQGAFIQYGCVAPYSVAKTANTVFWLGRDEEGEGIVWMAEGYQPRRISTYAVEQAIQSYGSMADATGHTYQENGVYFYCLSFPTANTTWVYDINLGQWHERAYFKDGAYSRHRADCHVLGFGLHLVGDYENGNIYEQSQKYQDDDGQEIRRERTLPHIADNQELEPIIFDRFQLDMQTGIGAATGQSHDVDPKIMLQWSDDGGRTFGNEHWESVGKMGEYKHRVAWRRLGRARDRVFRIAFTARAPLFVIGATTKARKTR